MKSIMINPNFFSFFFLFQVKMEKAQITVITTVYLLLLIVVVINERVKLENMIVS